MKKPACLIVLVAVTCCLLWCVQPGWAQVNYDDVVAFLQSAQLPDGSMPDPDPAAILCALRVLDAQPRDADALRAYLHSLEQPDGSFEGDLWPTLEAAVSLLLLGDRPSNQSQTIAYLASRQWPDGNFHDNDGWGDEEGMGVVLCTLYGLTEDWSWPGVDNAAAKAYLDARQLPNGSFSNHVVNTYWALLSYFILGQNPPDRNAARDYIVSSQQPDGHFAAGPAGGGPPEPYWWQAASAATLKYLAPATFDQAGLRTFIETHYRANGSWLDDHEQTGCAVFALGLLDRNLYAERFFCEGDWSLGPDILIRNDGEAQYTGDYVYSEFGSHQKKEQTTAYDVPAIYHLRVQNDRNHTGSFPVHAYVGSRVIVGSRLRPSRRRIHPNAIEIGGWTMAFYDVTGGNVDVTDDVMSGDWTTNSLPPGAHHDLRLEVTPDNTVPPGDLFEMSIEAVWDPGRGFNHDVAVAATTAAAPQPDMLIRNAVAPPEPYIGDDIYNDDGTNQTKEQAVEPTVAAVYELQAQNDGGVPDTLIITSPGVIPGAVIADGWTVAFYDALVGGNDVTDQVVGEGWPVGPLNPGEQVEFRAEIVPGITAPGGATKEILVTATSATHGSVSDTVLARTTRAETYQPDMMIRAAGEVDYIGDDIYDDGTAQTKTQAVAQGAPAVYHFKAQNDGNVPQRLRITAQIGSVVPSAATGPGWWVAFYDALTGHNDITDEVLGDGWLTPGDALQPGDAVEFRAVVGFGSDIPGEATQEILVTASPESQPKTGGPTDTVRALSTNQPVNQPDLLVRNGAADPYVGGDIYNTTGQGQTKSQSSATGATATYHVKLENDGNLPDSYTITASSVVPAEEASTSGWTVAFYDALVGGNDITAQIIGTGWPVGPLSPGATRELRVEVTPDSSVQGNTSHEVLVTARSAANSAQTDTIKAVTTKTATSRPDLLIRNAGEADYTGDGLYNADGQGQTRSQTVDTDVDAVYHLKLVNKGDTAERFTITASHDAVAAAAHTEAGWTIAFYDALTGYNDITAEVLGGGWTPTGALAPGAALEFRLAVKPDATVPGNAARQALVTASSADYESDSDTVKAVTTKLQVQPDALIGKTTQTHVGDGIYNATAQGQTEGQSVVLGPPAIFYLKAENDGNLPDTFTVSSPGLGSSAVSAGGWTVAYYDAVTGGSDITAQVVAGTWQVGPIAAGSATEFRVEITADSAEALDASKEVLTTVTSQADNAKADTVKAIATLLPPEGFEEEFGVGVWMLGVPARPLNPNAQAVFGTTDVARWDGPTQAYALFDDGPFDVIPGAGYWVKYPAGHTVSFEGYGLPGPVSPEVFVGWNLFGNPSPDRLPWTSIIPDGDVDAYAWVQNAAGTGYQLVWALAGENWLTEIAPWQGFWLRANEYCHVTLGAAAPAAAPKDGGDEIAWAMQLCARAGGAVDESNYLGIAEAGSGISVCNPPPLGGGYVDLYAVDAKGNRNAVSLAGKSGATLWDVVVETDLPNARVDVSFPDLSSVPGDLAVVLRDLATGRRVNMRTSRTYSFTSGEAGAHRRLRIEAKPRGQSAPILTSVAAQAGAGGMQIVYSLSAPAEVGIEVLNIAGRTVARVPCGYREAGTHTALWSGRNVGGSKAPPGRYLISVHCCSDDGTQSSRITPAQVR